ncbi:ABC transporter permease [Sphingobacterium faecium]|jgi:putative ABC transport system permease protein|uniref:ABC transporter permease n=1 Tax=Sphingobacterium faecium TaxID=34087 RepID=UPI0004E5EEC1|nr:ABC transporter permease [Sphingobacterium faecium]WGQ16176.1 ABC transporter permease [Sphingobacterium faecium]CDS97509.1 conserved membrane hypothetical protein [Sphingobacterium sp. PM2-P1-29]
MIKNYIKTAWRSIKNHQFFSILNIIGLAIGICTAVLLFAYVQQELSYDSMFKKGKNIYRVYMQTSPEYNQEKWIALPNAVGPAVKEDLSGVQQMTRLVKNDFGAPASIRAGDHNFIEKNLYLADSSLFSMFDFQFIEGNQETVFHQPKSIAISQSTKEKMFGSQSALNQMICVNQRDTFQVSAVYLDLPKNSTIDCEMISNIMDSWMGKNVYWSNASYETYIHLKDGTDPRDIAQQATKLIDKYGEKDNRFFTAFFLQPLSKVHLYSSDLKTGPTTRTGDIQTIRTLSVLAFLIIIIACVNYMNLATAKSQKSSKEVGINKVLGASRKQIIIRFYIETATISLIAMAIGIFLAILLLPLFNAISQNDIAISQILNWQNVSPVFIAWLSITLIAGSYPALYLSQIKSITLMKKGDNNGTKKVLTRQLLVLFQFATSITLIIGIIIMLSQMNFVKNKDLGYQPQSVLSIPIRSIKGLDKINALSHAIGNIPATKSSTYAQSIPGYNESGKTVYKFLTDKQGLPTQTAVTFGPIIETLGLQLLAGSDLPSIIGKPDSTCYVLINEVILHFLGYRTPEEAIGKPIITEMSATNSIIRGVVRDFNYSNLKSSIGGYTYYTMNKSPESPRNLLIRYQAGDLQAYLLELKKAYSSIAPEAAFDFTFLDQYIQSQYEHETRSSKVMTVFSMLTLFIACLGLLGLAAYTAELRSKEIGIRKVLGASAIGILNLLSSSYLKIILLAFLIASPIAYYLFNNWLNDFIYRIEMPIWAFVTALFTVMIMALMTIGYQTLKAAFGNPIKSLRDE